MREEYVKYVKSFFLAMVITIYIYIYIKYIYKVVNRISTIFGSNNATGQNQKTII